MVEKRLIFQSEPRRDWGTGKITASRKPTGSLFLCEFFAVLTILNTRYVGSRLNVISFTVVKASRVVSPFPRDTAKPRLLLES